MLTLPTIPLNLVATSGNNNISLTWQAPENNGGSPITNYNIYRGTSSGNETYLVTVGNVLNYTDSDLSSCNIYYYKISAVNIVGESPKSTETSAHSYSSPTRPLNPSIISSYDEISLYWSSPENNGSSAILGYYIYRGTFAQNLTLIETLINVSSNSLAYIDKGLSPNTTYYYQISAFNNIGEGPKSFEIHATTLLSNSSIAANSTISTNSSNSSNSTTPSNKSIPGMNIENILSASIFGIMVTVIISKKKYKNIDNLI